MTRYHTYNSLDSSPRTTEPRHILDANDAPEIRDRWRKVLGRQTILIVRQREGERWGYCGFGWFRHDLSGTNRAGNTWTKVRFAPNPMHFTRNTYFYENKDGSYFQINPDGSGFYDNRRGGVRYVDAEGNVLKKGLPDNSAAASGHSDAGISSSSINAKAEDCKKEEEGGNAVMKKEEEGGEVDLLRLEEQGNQDITIKSEKPEPVDHNQRVEIKKERSDSSSSLVSVSSYASDTLTAASSVGSLDGANGVWIKPEPVD